MSKLGSIKVELSAHPMEILEGSIHAQYIKRDCEHLYYSSKQCDICEKHFTSIAWYIMLEHVCVTTCSDYCAELAIHRHTMIMCDNCGYDIPRNEAHSAIAWNIPVHVCSTACLARLHQVWIPESTMHSTLRLIRARLKYLW